MFDRIGIASVTSNRPTMALASSRRDKVKAAGGYIVTLLGEGTSETSGPNSSRSARKVSTA